MLLRSRVVLPVTAPPIPDGAVCISGDRIAGVGRWADLRRMHTGPVVDLGEAVLLPGLVNAHCHLDYTDLAGHLPPPRSFTDWIQGVLGLKAGWSFSEYAASWLAGARQLLESGCTTVLDYEAVPELLPESWEGTPLRVISALELTGVRAARAPSEILASALRHAEGLAHPRHRVGLAPHAPYSTRAELLRLAAEAAAQRGWILTSHVAESVEEFSMFRLGSGRMHEWLQGQRDMSDCIGVTPVGHVARAGLLRPGTVLVHVNYLGDGDLPLLRGSGVTVVHCPRSHEYFGHAPFPMKLLRGEGVRVCLGTDSLLSTLRFGRSAPVLDLFAEVIQARRTMPFLSPLESLRMVTSDAAAALGLGGSAGELTPGAWADLVAVPDVPGADAVEAVVSREGSVLASMIGGTWALPPGWRDARGNGDSRHG